MEIAMKKAVYMALGVLLCLFWLAACGKGGTAETSWTIEARPGGCYLMTEETPDEICGDAKKIFSENLEEWVSVSNGGAGIRAASRSVVAGASHPLCVSRGRPVCRRRGYLGDPHA